ncbi:replication factor C small subunit [Candidatus Woesearchaeota archaeon]|nr:replication factor C small subunit [Candidatus Woesearchaeota archaeon]
MGEDAQIWTEKYRPMDFSDIKGQDDTVQKVEAFVKGRNMPHLLFTGPAGVGKTSISLVIARQLFGDGWRANFLELNASDERGIDVIRNKVKDFARTRAIGDVPFKLIYLDECDALTKEAQQALRRTMENYTQTTRFILSANYSSRIIDPIQSRCAVFRFRPLSRKDIDAIIVKISEKEGLKLSQDAKDALYEISGGDCRKVENILQSCAVISDDIGTDLIYSMASAARPEDLKHVLELAVDSRFVEARDALLKTMLDFGLSGLDVIKQIQKELLGLDADPSVIMQLMVHCGEAEFRMVEGSDEFVQLEAFLAKVVLAGEGKKKR